MFFADDFTLFSTATPQPYNVILGTLDNFCKASGQKLNHTKFKIVFSNNATPSIKSSWAIYLNMLVSDTVTPRI